MNQFRMQQTAALIPSGKVLEISGYAANTAELYDPSTGTSSFTASLNVERDQSAGTLLNDNGMIELPRRTRQQSD